MVEFTPCGGHTPRGFRISPDGARLFAANQDSNEIVRFNIDPASGRLGDATTVARLDKPECIQFVEL